MADSHLSQLSNSCSLSFAKTNQSGTIDARALRASATRGKAEPSNES